jgi:hypothetical protein
MARLNKLKITAGSFVFGAVLEAAAAPKTVAAFRAAMAYEGWQGAQTIRFEQAAKTRLKAPVRGRS